MSDYAARVCEEFTRQADTLARAPVFTDEALLARMCAAVPLSHGTRVLDVASGPGLVAKALAPDVGLVVTCDLTPAMLRQARQRCQQAGQNNVVCIRGHAEVLPFADASFSAVVSRAALHHFPHPMVALTEMARVTRTLGRLALVDVVTSENSEEATLHNALEVLRDPSHRRMLPRSELLAQVQQVGFTVQTVETWTLRRKFDEWLRITNAPERAAPLWAVMTALAKAGIRAGIDLHLEGETLLFTHTFVFVIAEKR